MIHWPSKSAFREMFSVSVPYSEPKDIWPDPIFGVDVGGRPCGTDEVGYKAILRSIRALQSEGKAVVTATLRSRFWELPVNATMADLDTIKEEARASPPRDVPPTASAPAASASSGLDFVRQALGVASSSTQAQPTQASRPEGRGRGTSGRSSGGMSGRPAPSEEQEPQPEAAPSRWKREPIGP